MYNMHPQISDAYKKLPNTANISKSEFCIILGINEDKFSRLYTDGHIPKVTYTATKFNKFHTKKHFWNMKTVKEYVDNFEKWVAGDLISNNGK